MKPSVVLIEPKGEVNIGAIARVMKNFDINDLILVKPSVSISTEARRYAMHARDVLDNVKIVESLELTISNFDFLVGTTAITGGDHNLLRMPITPEQLIENITEVSGNIAFLFGREADGLTNEELEYCDVVVNIPANPEYPSLNISHAAAIIFYFLFKATKDHEPTTFRASSKKEKDIIIDYWSSILELIDYYEKKRYIPLRILKAILGRAFISGREAHTLAGVLRKIERTLKFHKKLAIESTNFFPVYDDEK